MFLFTSSPAISFLIEDPLNDPDYFLVLCKSTYNMFDSAKSQLCTHKVSLPPPLCTGDGGALAAAESPLSHKQVLCSHRWENTCPGGVWTFCSSKDTCGIINSSGGAIKERRAVTNALNSVLSAADLCLYFQRTSSI